MSVDKELSYKSEAARLVKFRKKHQISQVELAELLGTKQPYISRVEKGESPLMFHHLRILRNKYKFNINWYCTGQGTMISGEEDKSTLIADVTTVKKDYEDLGRQYDELKKIVYKLVRDVYDKGE
ncbi:helix-turn-helix domain-containing protein [Sphingobacterium paludis]|uniref:Helix-turn-helix protein n=1 Tax=Sphingobacterium paludis TaxID=1476465 RepID=A0A4R7D534_9SPHI|nr:helix-turn-helix transcriptional regulator [Sphingobacterium paludis]TDS14784.1 helix-turn-helix protein [Sphingobacterium paludis]